MLLSLLAAAHVPHDTVAMAEAGPEAWWLVADPLGVHLLARSTDRGRSWEMVGGEAMAEDPVDLAVLADGSLVLLSGTRLWLSPDGASWSTQPLPGEVSFAAGGEDLLLAGPGGVWRGPPTALVQELEAEVELLGPGAVLAGAALHLDDGAWTAIPAPAGTSAVAFDGTTAWAGTTAGELWRWDGAWLPCGALPELDHGEIRNLAFDGGRLLLATALRAPFVSEDACASWTDRSTGADVEYDVSGGASGPGEAFPVLFAADGTWLAAGWAGVRVSEDAGGSWTHGALVPVDYTRGVDFADTRLWLGGYGAGPTWTDDGGESFEAAGHGLGHPNVQAVQQAGAGAHVYALVNYQPFLSVDGGDRWRGLPVPLDSLSFFAPVGLRTWAFGSLDGARSAWASADGGASWEPLSALDEALAGGNPSETRRLGDFVCLTGDADGRLLCTADEGESWVTSSSGVEGPSSAVVGWPPRAPERLLWADPGGVHHVGAPGETPVSQQPTGEDPPELLADGDDGTLWLITHSGAIWRSDDGGDHWSELGLRLPVPADRARVRPWGGELVIGTHDGLFVVVGEELSRFARWQILSVRAGHLEAEGCPDPVADDEAVMDLVLPVGEGCVLRSWVRGTKLGIWGRAAGGSAELAVDGVAVASLGAGAGILAELELADGWHELQLSGVGAGIELERIEAWGPATVLSPLAEPEPEDCGCDQGSAAGLLLLAGCRRRRPPP